MSPSLSGMGPGGGQSFRGLTVLETLILFRQRRSGLLARQLESTYTIPQDKTDQASVKHLQIIRKQWVFDTESITVIVDLGKEKKAIPKIIIYKQ